MKSPKLQNLLFIVIVLAIAVFLLGRPKKQGATATVTLPDQNQQIISLDTNGQYDFEANGYTVHLVVEDGSIRFVDSECPDHLCEGFGRLSNADEMATCLPAGVSVVVNP